ncbi:hypothetical protein [Kribbella kalugense]|uniref:Uncharacterized protein n=1 Tax=Kribbella kalugense TaxID=2512221 RepID=A0A4R7ZJV4_9ACTN|nr:hypothetical protein [Kribbella kalugense]TDW17595.1 hypothetical protein EV650_4162 [Kribbella kalugense]
MPDAVQVSLTTEERMFLLKGLGEWGGPARCTDQLAIGMGFEGRDHFHEAVARLREALQAGEPLSHEDWRRVLLETEVVFVSDVVGSGLDWSTTSGITDSDSIGLLRSIQRKMPRWRPTFQFTLDRQGDVVISEPERPRG